MNKHIVCPTCGKSETVYIDLHEIRTDPNVGSGVVKRSFIHEDHVLLLDLDYNGDIRTVIKLNQTQDVSIDRDKFSQIREIMQNYENLAILSNDPSFSFLIEQIIDADLPNSTSFDLMNNEFELKLMFNNKLVRVIRKLSVGIMKSLDKIDCCIIDNLDPIILKSKNFVEHLVSCKQLICLNETIHSILLHEYPDIHIDLIS